MRNTVPDQLHREVEWFLYTEARLLEDNQFDEWLSYFTDDVRYWMPVRENMPMARLDSDEEADRFGLFDDDKKSLALRVLRIKTGQAHAEVPPSTTLRLITNVLAWPANDASEPLTVTSNFSVYQERRGGHGVTFYGRRTDQLRRVGDRLKIARRRIDLAQTVLPSTVSIFF